MSDHRRPLKISVIIPNFNGGDTLRECIESAVGQGWPEKEILVIDGGSTDLSPKILRDYEKELDHWESAPDAGPYHAVEKGLDRAAGDVLCWLNSDDILLPGALEEVAEIFSDDPETRWLSGMHATFLEMSVLLERGYPTDDFFLSDDTRYAVQLFRNIDHIDWSLKYILEEAPLGGYFLQQESTFWRRDLWQSVGGFDHRYSLAADYWLWLRFLEQAPLTLVDRPFGCFRQSQRQRSAEQKERYREEALDIAAREAGAGWIARRPTATVGNLPDIDGTQTPTSSPMIRVRRLVKERFCLATSIAPVSLEKQAFCIKTWTEQGCRILSFNTPEEAGRIQAAALPELKDVVFVPVENTARATTGKDLVLLRDIIDYYQDQAPETILGILNSDIMIERHIDLLSFAKSSCDGEQCLVSSRVDLEDYWDRDGQIFIGGFDAFFFPFAPPRRLSAGVRLRHRSTMVGLLPRSLPA